jgi:hypothetical protein
MSREILKEVLSLLKAPMEQLNTPLHQEIMAKVEAELARPEPKIVGWMYKERSLNRRFVNIRFQPNGGANIPPYSGGMIGEPIPLTEYVS